MDVVEWRPGIKNHAYLYICARLTCPFCLTEVEVETICQLFYGLPTADGGRIGSTSSSIETVIEDLSKQRACGHCGIVSIVPMTEQNRVLAEAHNTLTSDWCQAESRRTREAETASA